MVVWLNGPYGVGKSTLAEKLRERVPDSFVFDAEEVGNAVRENMPPERFNGYIFEGYPLWFRFCAELLRDILDGRETTVFVPMTLVYKDSFEKIAQPLAAHGIEARHILLTSTRDVVRGRILARGEDADCWCAQNIDLCLENQAEFENVLRVESVGRTVDELADEVLALLS